MNARDLLRANIDRLLEVRGQSRGQMAAEMDRASSWISQILGGTRGRFLDHIDALADHLQVHPSVLFGCPTSALSTSDKGSTVPSRQSEKIGAHTARAGSGGIDVESVEGPSVPDDSDQRKIILEELLSAYNTAPTQRRKEFLETIKDLAADWRREARDQQHTDRKASGK